LSKYVVLMSNESGAGKIVYQDSIDGPNRPAIFKSRKGAENFAGYMTFKFREATYTVEKANVFP
jgi:hypothetical protein